MIDIKRYSVYVHKDRRTRAYDKETHAIVSYPKLLMENILGRPLEPDEHVHHRDGNPLNNNPWNLVVMNISEHEKMHAKQNKLTEKQKKFFERKYFDKEMICPICGQTFIWTARSQSNKATRPNATSRPPCCSPKCRYISYHRSYTKEIKDIQALLYEVNGNFLEASRRLGVSDVALHKRLRKAGLPYKSKDYRNNN